MSDIIEDIDRTLRVYVPDAIPLGVRRLLSTAKQEIQSLRTSVELVTRDKNILLRALEDLVERCDGDEGIRKDGENIDTRSAHAALGHFNDGDI